MITDICDIRRYLRAFFFSRDRDITLMTSRVLVLGDGTEIPSSSLVPIGGIILWSGAIVSIPTNWQICDGTNGTPNLCDRFVVGAGSTYAVGATGGAATINIAHTHGGATGGENSHTHTSGSFATDNDTHNHLLGQSGFRAAAGTDEYVIEYADAATTNNDTHSHDVTGTSAAGSSHGHSISSSLSSTQSILPPYFSLCYIQRIS